jgi:release factor glutamine methyltransferase
VSEPENKPAGERPNGDGAPSTLHSPLSTVDSPPSWTIGKLLNSTARLLAERGSEFPRLDAEVLLAHSLGCRRIELYTRYEQGASDELRDHFRALVRRRIDGCPVAYLVGRKEFFSLEFEVGPAVLIPRPESEFVVMECLRLAKGVNEPRALDIGTGSGNIAVAVARQHPGAVVTAVDLSAPALALARRNADRHGVAPRIRFLLGDLFEPLGADALFDFVLSNPPYIAEAELSQLPRGVREHEPHLALNGGPSGYEVFQRLVSGACQHLVPGGHLIVEIGAPQERTARDHILAHPGYRLADTLHDYSGHARVLCARWQP